MSRELTEKVAVPLLSHNHEAAEFWDGGVTERVGFFGVSSRTMGIGMMERSGWNKVEFPRKIPQGKARGQRGLLMSWSAERIGGGCFEGARGSARGLFLEPETLVFGDAGADGVGDGGLLAPLAL